MNRALRAGGLVLLLVSSLAPRAAAQDTTVPLESGWLLSVRYRAPEGPWEAPLEVGEVSVPGFYYPEFGFSDREVELTYVRPLLLPEEWRRRRAAGRHVLVEFDSVDYRSTVELGSGGTFEALGSHEGYLGRFAFDLGDRAGDTLRVRAWDLRQGTRPGMAEAAKVPRTTLQGMDPTAWGINVAGILEPVRLRLVGPSHLRQAFVAVLRPGDPATVRVAAEVVPLEAGPRDAEVRWEVALAGASGTIPVRFPAAAGQDVEVYRDISIRGLPMDARTEMRIQVVHGASVSDVRTVPLVNRRVDAAEGRLRLNGEPFFLKGIGIHHTSRFLPVDGLGVTDIYQPASFTAPSRYQGDARFLDRQLDRLADGVRASGASWIRPAHHVPVRALHERMRASGILVYQDFPLHWNTDFVSLPPEEILRQFDEFLWRAAAEPAVAVISLHNEAEILDAGPDRRTVHALLQKMRARAAELCPHLVVVGNSGGAGTATFPEDPAFPLADDVIDRHAYLNSVFLPHLGYREIPRAVGLVAASDGRPVIWSELSGGWGEHFQYLLGLRASITGTPLARALERFLVFGGRHLSIRQFYAAVSALRYDSVAPEDLLPAIERTALPANDARLIERAHDHFFADLLATTEPDSGDEILWRRRICAAWLAAQIYEARALYLSGGPMAGTIPWDTACDTGVPMILDGFGEALPASAPDVRSILARAYAPLALYARPAAVGQEIDLVILNDGPPVTGTLVVDARGIEVFRRAFAVGALAMTTCELEACSAAVRDHPGEVVTAALRVGGAPVSEYRLVVPQGQVRQTTGTRGR